MKEIELKLLVDAAAAERARAMVADGALGARDVAETTLRAVYHDTPDRALAAQRIALRVRKEGRRWVQCAKIGGGVVAGLSTTAEFECPAPAGRLRVAAIPDAAARAAVQAAVGEAALAPVCETDMRRVSAQLTGPFGGVVELALDEGEIRAGDARAALREAELELKDGDPRDLYACAKALFAAGGVRFSRRNKARRGFDLADGRCAVADPPPPVFAKPLLLDAAMTTEAAAAAVLRDCLDQIAANAAASAADDGAEGPHQLRVGLRRLRTAATVFADALGGPTLSALDAEARALAAVIGRLRDLDVLAEDVVAPMAAQDPRLAPLGVALADPREAARVAARARLRDARTGALLFDLGGFIEGRGWLRREDFAQTASLARPVRKTAARAIEARWRKAATLGARIDALQGDARHDLRKALKKLRYAVEFFASLWPAKQVKPFRARLKALQDDFGALQDLAMAEETLCGPDAPALADPAAQRGVGLLLGRWEAKAAADWSRAKAEWAALAAAPRFWR